MKHSEALSRTQVTTPEPRTANTPEPARGRFRLTGPSRDYDPRIHAVRRDVADIALADFIFAPHYALAEQRAIASASVMLRTSPLNDVPAGSQLLFGEEFALLDAAGGWAWGYCGQDHYVGYVPLDALGAPVSPTHIVSVREAPLFSAADIKSAVVRQLTLGARVEAAPAGDFLQTSEGFLHVRHAAPVGEVPGDAVDIAARLLGAPYLWGGRGAGGVDCSGLVQIALQLSGLECPRDSDQQRAALGRELGADEALRRGDLVFFPGHVGFMADEISLLHANAWWMSVVVEPLGDVVNRLKSSYEEPILARRRLGQ